MYVCVHVCDCAFVRVCMCSATSSSHSLDRQQACVCIACLSNINEPYIHTHSLILTHQDLRGQRVSQSSNPLQRHILEKKKKQFVCVLVYVCAHLEQGAGSCQGLGAAGTNEADE